ncbi:hypothetical protein BGW41_004918 [Actinomortierella wolfii]|nr:hypothetical protein BGW41_004918 [Actinomortierella wolfii]
MPTSSTSSSTMDTRRINNPLAQPPPPSSSSSISLLVRSLPRLVLAGMLWITLVVTAAHLLVLSHLGFLILNCFSHLTGSTSSSSTATSSSQQELQHPPQQQRPQRQDRAVAAPTDDITTSLANSPQHPISSYAFHLFRPIFSSSSSTAAPSTNTTSSGTSTSYAGGLASRLMGRNNRNANSSQQQQQSSSSSQHQSRTLQSNTQSGQAMAGMSTAKKVFAKEEWEAQLAKINVDRDDLNKLIMNYLIIEGYKDAAEKFSQESGATPPVNLESIQDRMIVRTAIQRGNIEEAIDRVNDLNPEILDTNPKLFFHLQQQRLIEYIREGRISEALEFAQEELAPRGEENPEFLAELERTMSLLAFELNAPSPVSDLLTPAQRQKLASELNSALLLSQSQEKDPKLPNMLKMLAWAQQQLEERVIFPKIKDFSKAELVVEPPTGPGGSSLGNGGGSVPVPGA